MSSEYTMKFGMIDRYMLLGGGKLMVLLSGLLRNKGIPVYVVTSSRHAREEYEIDGVRGSLECHLQRLEVDFHISVDISCDSKVLSKITDSTLGFSFGAAWLFKADFINRFSGRLLNLHASRLPRDRGCGGYSWRIMRGDRGGSCLIHLIDEGVDTGGIVVSEEFEYPPECRRPIEYSEFTISKYLSLLTGFIDRVSKEDEFVIAIQDESTSTYWPRLATMEHGYIDWSWSVYDLEHFICAFDEPYAGARTFIGQNKVHLKNVSVSMSDGGFHPFQRGMIYRIHAGAVYVAAGEGALLVKNVVDAEGRDVKDDLRVGDRLYTPTEFLEQALSFRAKYTPNG